MPGGAADADERIELDRRERRGRRPHVGRRDEKTLGRREEAPRLLRFRCVGDRRLPRALEPALDARRLVEPEARAVGNVVEDGRELAVDVGHHELDPRHEKPVLERVGERVPLEARHADLDRARLDGATGFRRAEVHEGYLPSGQDDELLARVARALRVGIEGADALDAVALHLETQRQRLERGKHVDDAAADAELAAVLDERDALVPPRREMRREDFNGDRVALHEIAHRFGQDGARQDALRERVGGRDDDRRPALQQVKERRDAVGDDGRRRRDGLERRHVPRRQEMDLALERRRRCALAEKEREIGRERLRRAGIRCDDEKRRRLRAIRLGDEQRAAPAAQPFDAQRPPGGDRRRTPRDVGERGTFFLRQMLHTRMPAPAVRPGG